MITYPNQRIITIKENAMPEKGANERFVALNYETMMKAMRDLTPTTHHVWVYLNANKNGYEFALSTTDICAQTGLSPSTAKKAINELIEKRYLVLQPNKTKHYDFYAMPQENTNALPNPTSKVVPFVLPSPASKEEDYRRADIQPLRPQVKERKSLTTDAICSLLAEEC